MLCALWCCWGGKLPISGSLLAPFFGLWDQEGQLALNASLTWVAGDFGSCEDQGQLFRFVGVGAYVVCGLAHPPL